MKEQCSFLWSFLPAKLAKKTTEKEIFRSAEDEKRCLRTSYPVKNGLGLLYEGDRFHVNSI